MIDVANPRHAVALTVVRCGETAWAADGRVHGATDLPLSPAGREFVADAAATLASHRIPTVWHPADDAAREAARIVARAVRGRARVAAELAEPDLGLLEGLTRVQFAERFPKRSKQWQDDPVSLLPPEGEPIAEARERILRGLARRLRRSRAGETAVVLHPFALGLVRCRLGDRPPSGLWSIVQSRPPVERYLVARSRIAELADE